MSIGFINHTAVSALSNNPATTPTVSMAGATSLYAVTFGFFGVPALTDSQGNIYTNLTALSNSNGFSALWVCDAPTVPGAGMFWSTSGANYYETIAVIGLSGTPNPSYDQYSGGQAASSTTTQTRSVGGTAGDAFLSFLLGYPTTPITVDSGADPPRIRCPRRGIPSGYGSAYTLSPTFPLDPTWTSSAGSLLLQAYGVSVLAGSGGGGGTTYYVNISGGSDSNTGLSVGAAFLNTVSKGATPSSTRGDITLPILPGTYTRSGDRIDSTLLTLNSGTSSAPITVQAYPGGFGATTTPGPRTGSSPVILQPPAGNAASVLFVNIASSPNHVALSYWTFLDLVMDGINNSTVGDDATNLTPGCYINGFSQSQFIKR